MGIGLEDIVEKVCSSHVMFVKLRVKSAAPFIGVVLVLCIGLNIDRM